MKHKYIFLLGRPGCGKSALYRELGKRILASGQAKTIERVDDFPILWARIQRDDALEKEGKERIYSTWSKKVGYHITYPGFFDEILQQVNSDVLKIDKPDHMIFLEFARPGYVQALQNIDQRILGNCIVIYLQVSFNTCWERNVARHQAAVDRGGDDHLVPRKTMEEIYLHDDRDALIQQMKDQNIPVSLVDNEADGEDHLVRQVEELFANVFKDWRRKD